MKARQEQRSFFERLRRGARAFGREISRATRSDDFGNFWPFADKAGTGNRFFLDWIMRTVNADDEVRRSGRRLRGRARDLRDTAPYVEQALTLISNNVVGPNGPKISPQVKLRNSDKLDKTTNDRIKDWWQRFADSRVTADGKLNLVEYMHVGLSNHVLEGELFTRHWVGFDNKQRFALEPIDPDMVDESINRNGAPDETRVVMGIELDRWRRPLAYHVLDEETLGYGSKERQRIPADQVIHNYRMRRLNQTRAMTWLYPVLVALKMDASYTEAELMAACIGAAKMGFFRTTDGMTAGEVADENKNGEFIMDIEPGIFGKLPPGWTVEPFNADHPASAFAAFQKQIGRKIAVGIGLSYPSLSGDLEVVNYGSMRGGKLDERDFYMRLQEYWCSHFLTPIYRKALEVALLTGDLYLGTYDPSLFYDVAWTCRGWTWVDPLKDIQAAAIAIEKGLDSRTRILEEQGLDFETVARQLAAEKALAEELDIDITGSSSGSAPVAAADDENQDEKPNQDQNGRGRRARRFLPLADVGANGNGH